MATTSFCEAGEHASASVRHFADNCEPDRGRHGAARLIGPQAAAGAARATGTRRLTILAPPRALTSVVRAAPRTPVLRHFILSVRRRGSRGFVVSRFRPSRSAAGHGGAGCGCSAVFGLRVRGHHRPPRPQRSHQLHGEPFGAGVGERRRPPPHTEGLGPTSAARHAHSARRALRGSRSDRVTGRALGGRGRRGRLWERPRNRPRCRGGRRPSGTDVRRDAPWRSCR